ncbi:repressor LexA [Enterocloster clostridioformis]|nr:repressor LexA [Lachnoclostridium sp. YL32]NDO32512.1 transcriptional repressor LexA [Enterocloster clostridioformis]OXE63524.1 repressor LexA [Enterocloster clostridioformis]QQR00041.1 transcriptional repressor LexA [Enterocloster clostridioformis]
MEVVSYGRHKKLNQNGLTNKAQRIYDFIVEEQERVDYPPSVREICEYMGLKSTSSSHSYLKLLEAKGLIKRDPIKPRALEIISNKTEQQCKIIHAPIIGDVAAGTPILANQNIDGYCRLPAEDFGRKDVYMLRVHGDSMINAGIYDGDKVIVENTDTAENGEIVVALVDDSATIKRFFKENGWYRLQPENDSMSPPMYFNQVMIQGKIIGLLRTM